MFPNDLGTFFLQDTQLDKIKIPHNLLATTIDLTPQLSKDKKSQNMGDFYLFQLWCNIVHCTCLYNGCGRL